MEEADIVRKVFSVIPYWKIPICAGVLLITQGVMKFWGAETDWVLFAIIFILHSFLIIVAALLEIRFAMTHKNLLEGYSLLCRKAPWSNSVSIDADKDLSQFNFSIYMLAALAVFMDFCLLKTGLNAGKATLLLAAEIISIFLFAFSGSISALSGLEEVLDGIIVSILPSVFLISSSNMMDQMMLTWTALILPVYFLFLAFRFTSSMKLLESWEVYNPGFFKNLIENSSFILHHAFLFAVYVVVVVMNRMGVQWRILWPQLLLVPTLSLQIFLAERVKTQNKLMNILLMVSFINLFLLMYMDIYTLWIGVIA